MVGCREFERPRWPNTGRCSAAPCWTPPAPCCPRAAPTPSPSPRSPSAPAWPAPPSTSTSAPGRPSSRSCAPSTSPSGPPRSRPPCRRAGTPAGKIEAYVRSQLTLVGDRRHRAVVAISAGELDAGAREKIRAAHGGLVAMVVAALSALGHPEPRLTAMLLQGVVDAAVRRIELGAAETPAAIVEAAVEHGPARRHRLTPPGTRPPGAPPSAPPTARSPPAPPHTHAHPRVAPHGTPSPAPRPPAAGGTGRSGAVPGGSRDSGSR